MSAKYCTNRISAEKNEFIVTPASSMTFVENPRWRALARAYTIPTAAIDPAKLATGTLTTCAAANAPVNVIASMAPRAAPAETPNVNGVASGLRSRAWNTTPAAASALPTQAAASTRGSLATKKICASTLSANAIEGSNTRRRSIGVLPTSGARRHAEAATSPKPATARTSDRLMGAAAATVSRGLTGAWSWEPGAEG